MMTQGERMIWAAAYALALKRSDERAVLIGFELLWMKTPRTGMRKVVSSPSEGRCPK